MGSCSKSAWRTSLTVIRAYFHSTATLNYIRTLLTSGFADLHKPLDWSFSNVRSPELQEAFAGVIDSLQDSIDFMKVATGKSGGQARGGLETVDIYTRCVPLQQRRRVSLMSYSHEALLLEYEEALTRAFTDTHPTSPPPATPSQTPPMSRSVSSIRGESSYPHSPVRPSRLNSINPFADKSQQSEAKHYNVSSHFIWIGDRTRQLDGAHVEYFRGIANPM